MWIGLYEVMETAGLPQPEYRVEAFMLYATIRNTKIDTNLGGTPKSPPRLPPKSPSKIELLHSAQNLAARQKSPTIVVSKISSTSQHAI